MDTLLLASHEIQNLSHLIAGISIAINLRILPPFQIWIDHLDQIAVFLI